MPARVTQDDIAETIALGRQGRTWIEIGERFGITANSAYSRWQTHATAADLAVRWGSMTPGQRERNKQAARDAAGRLARIADHSSPAGAERLAARIAAFWAARGFAVECTAALTLSGWRPIGDARPFWGVRSDLVGGLPQRRPPR